MTQGLTPADCRDTLRRILADELALLDQLATQLADEHAQVVANDIDGLERISTIRQDCVARLMALGDERQALCRLLGRGGDLAGQAALLAWCDPDGELGPLLARHGERSQACREQNERNGVLVGARMARLNGMLGLLAGAGAGNAARTYGRGGQLPGVTVAAGRLVAARA